MSFNGGKIYWYKRFRLATYTGLAASIIWTVFIVLPFRPFSYLPPIIVGGGPGIWFVLSYLLLLMVGVAGFGTVSGLLHTIEADESRSLNPLIMSLALVLLGLGTAFSCGLLAVAGAVGGYDSTVLGTSGSSVHEQLSLYVYPITATSLATLAGAALTLTGMIRAR